MVDLWLRAGYQLLTMVALITLLIYLVSRFEVVTKFIASEKPSMIGTIVTIIVLGVVICLASKYAYDIGSAKTNARTAIAFFAALVGGPIAGIAVGLIGGIYRYTLGGWTMTACVTATILAGFIGAGIVHYTNFRPKDINPKSILFWAVLTFVWETVHVQVLAPWIGDLNLAVSKKMFAEPTFTQAFNWLAEKLYVPMISLNVIAIVTFLFLLRDMVMNDYRVKLAEQLDEQNKLIAEVEDLRAKLMEKEEDSTYKPAATSGGSIEQTS